MLKDLIAMPMDCLNIGFSTFEKNPSGVKDIEYEMHHEDWNSALIA